VDVNDVRPRHEDPGGPDGLDQAARGAEDDVLTADVRAHEDLVAADHRHRGAGVLLSTRQQRDMPLHPCEPVGADDVQDPHRGMVVESRLLATPGVI
jgi:hypothetical protein